MNRSLAVEVKVGVFVVIGLTLAMITLTTLGGGRSLFQKRMHLKARFAEIEGLVEGANVKLAGIKIGKIEEVRFLKDERKVEIAFGIEKKYAAFIHQDGQVGVRTQGVLGDKFLIVMPGTTSAPLVSNGSELTTESAKEIKDYLNTADELMEHLRGSLLQFESILSQFNRDKRSETFFKNMSQLSVSVNSASQDLKGSMERLKSILTKIDTGHGTMGALINDSAIYDDLRNLLGTANRSKVLKYFVRKSAEESREASKK